MPDIQDNPASAAAKKPALICPSLLLLGGAISTALLNYVFLTDMQPQHMQRFSDCAFSAVKLVSAVSVEQRYTDCIDTSFGRFGTNINDIVLVSGLFSAIGLACGLFMLRNDYKLYTSVNMSCIPMIARILVYAASATTLALQFMFAALIDKITYSPQYFKPLYKAISKVAADTTLTLNDQMHEASHIFDASKYAVWYQTLRQSIVPLDACMVCVLVFSVMKYFSEKNALTHPADEEAGVASNRGLFARSSKGQIQDANKERLLGSPTPSSD